MVERLNGIEEVSGSIPLGSSPIFLRNLRKIDERDFYSLQIDGLKRISVAGQRINKEWKEPPEGLSGLPGRDFPHSENLVSPGGDG